MNIKNMLTGTMRRMHHVHRYSSVPVINRESVAAHSWEVAFYSMLVGTDMIERHYEVNFERLMVKAVSHDVSEALSGDIIRSYKHSSQEIRKACQAADEINMNRLATEIDGLAGAYLFKNWYNAKNVTLEGAIVSFADMLCVVAYCVEEWRMGNRPIARILEGLYGEALSEYHKDSRFAPYMEELFPNRDWSDPLEGQ